MSIENCTSSNPRLKDCILFGTHLKTDWTFLLLRVSLERLWDKWTGYVKVTVSVICHRFNFLPSSLSSELLISTFWDCTEWLIRLKSSLLRYSLLFSRSGIQCSGIQCPWPNRFVNHCAVHNFSLHFSVFSDAERSDCATKEDPSVNYIRNSSRRGQMNDQTFAAGFLRISENETMPSPTRLFHWDTYTMYGKDQEHEFPVYLLDINGFGVNTFVQIETTAPLPTRRRSKKRSQKKASERRLSKQTMISDG